jgi:tetratricopeptide (TPR) repeat protein
LDCRINAYPYYTGWKGLNRQAPNFLFIDLDLSRSKSIEELNRVLDKTLKFIKKKFKDYNISPSVFWTGNGYHIYLPVEASILELESIFSEFENPSRQFIRWSEQFLSNRKADPCHSNSLSFRNCMLRVHCIHASGGAATSGSATGGAATSGSATGGAATSGLVSNNSAAVVNSLLDKAYAFKHQRNYPQAIPLFQKALATDPNNEYALIGIGWALVEDGANWSCCYKEVMKYSDKALSIDPNNIQALNLKGCALLYGDLGKYNESIAYFDKALSINPYFTAAIDNKGEALSQLGMYNESIAYFDKALHTNPNYKQALDHKGWALINLGNYTQAIPLFDRALAIDPNWQDALDGRAQAIAVTTENHR